MQRGDDTMTHSIAILDILTLCNIDVGDTIIQDVSVDIGLIRFLFFDERSLLFCWCMLLKLTEVVYDTIKNISNYYCR